MISENANEKYTQKEDWQLHWSNFKPIVVTKSNLEDLCKDLPECGSFIEIGGFPGFYSVFFKKTFNYDVHLLDYIVIPEIIHEMEKINNIPLGSINVINADFFSFNSVKKYDIVFSYGFIEHFKDIEGVIKRHVNLLNENGKLLIVLPNLRGISGWFLKITDPNLYRKHNLKSMDIDLLKDISRKIGLKEIEVGLYGKPHVWINASSPIDSKIIRLFVKIFNGFSQRIPLKNYLLSPLIYIKAVK
jgi:SAM-dependent methyltransferase